MTSDTTTSTETDESQFILECDDVYSGYTEVDIIEGIDFSLALGEIVTIIGPNGAGKSTFIKTMFGLVDLRGGTVVFDGTDISGMEPNQINQLGMCYVPQVESIFPNLTVLDNLKMGAYTRDDYDNLDPVMARFPALEEKRNAPVKKLSGGQQRMVAIGMALMLDPDVLLIDEPSAGLAPKLVDEVFGQLDEINDQGMSIVVVEQNAQKSLSHADRGYVLDSGEVRFEGNADDLLRNPDVRSLYLGK